MIYATGIVFHGVCGSTSISTFLFPSFSSLKVTISINALKIAKLLISTELLVAEEQFSKKMADP